MTNVFSLRSRVAGAAMLFCAGLAPGAAEAASFSFVGNISRDDEVQLFNFTINNSSNVILKTLSWAGGTNADGVTIAAGGFDPILAVFSADGTKIAQIDDGATTENSGERLDAYREFTPALLLQDNIRLRFRNMTICLALHFQRFLSGLVKGTSLLAILSSGARR